MAVSTSPTQPKIVPFSSALSDVSEVDCIEIATSRQFTASVSVDRLASHRWVVLDMASPFSAHSNRRMTVQIVTIPLFIFELDSSRASF